MSESNNAQICFAVHTNSRCSAGFSPAVLRAERVLTGEAAIRYQQQENLARRLATLWMEGLRPQELDREAAGIKAVTPEQVLAVGARYFAPRRMSIVAVGDVAVIRAQLASLGIPLKSFP